MRRRFFVERFEVGRAVLRGDAAHHAGRVLRAEPGQLYELSDGRDVWLARIERVGRDALDFSLLERIPAAAPALATILALSIVKFDRFEWALEKATELGVTEVIPLAADRSEKGLVTAAPKRAGRWEKILLEASQQSRRLRPPVLHPLKRDCSAFLAGGGRATQPSMNPAEVCLFFSEREGALSLRAALEPRPSAKRILLAIGPEGGWTEDEFRAARQGKWAEVSLGSNILRTETAVVAALAAVEFASGSLSG